MNISNFLEKSIAGKMSENKQEKYLRSKQNYTAEELAETVLFLEKQMPQKSNFKNCVDVCGTGGSGLKRINTSTISAFILASLGVGVAKHGNRAASGRFGSFDLLESLGISFSSDISDIKKIYNIENLAFFFAPYFHPVMKNFAEARKKIGKPSFFNILGPLMNPASAKKQIIGTAFKDKMEILAETCGLLGKEKVFVVCGEDSLDEVTLTGKTFVTELSGGKIKNYTISPEDFGVKRAPFEEIKGGSARTNLEIALKILQGTCETRHLDLVLINAALGLKLADKAKMLKEGYEMALDAVKRGIPFEKLQRFKTISEVSGILLEIVENKRKEVEKRKISCPIGEIKYLKNNSERDFASALIGKKTALIAEIKRYSPSSGKIHDGVFSPAEIAKNCEAKGAAAISVVCDKKYFHGNLKYLKQAQENTKKIPILCKDFIIDEYQIYEAKKYGTDAILLIAAILTEKQLTDFMKTAESLKMAALCEVHIMKELQKVLKTPAKIIGINNRDLKTLKVDLSVTRELAKHVPDDKIIVSESGIKSREDVRMLPENINAILVGTSLMKGVPITEFVADNFVGETKKYKLASRVSHTRNTLVKISDKVVFGGKKPVIIAGPCAIESEKQLLTIAEKIKELGADMLRGGAYKPRTSPYSFQGMGEEGLKIMRKVSDEVGLPCVSEITSTENLDLFVEYVDMIQIGSRNMQNFDLIQKVADAKKPILLKRGMSATMEEFLLAAEYILKWGNGNVVLCERGIRTFETSTRNILDLNTMALVKKESHLPIIADPSHSAGRYDLVIPLSLAALSAGADGLIVEVHDKPKEALSDGEQSLTFNTFESLMKQL